MYFPRLNQVSAASAPASVWARSTHILELDGLRGLAILMVTIYRFGRDIPTDSTLGAVLHQAISLGDRGVDLFFVLSGFLITGVLLDSRDEPHYFKNFFARRTLRIFPLYFASLLLFLIVIPAIWPESHPFQMAQAQQLYLWSYMANVRMVMLDAWCFGSLDHFWSLAVEEHFYALWPLFILLLGTRYTLPFAVLAAAACGAGRVAFALLGENHLAPDVMSGFRFDGLLVGAAIAVMARRAVPWRILRPCAAILLPVMIAICLGLAIYGGRLLTISHSMWAVLWGSVLVVLLSSDSVAHTARAFRWGWLRSLGRYSYAMYVFQSPLIPLVAGIWSVGSIAAWMNQAAEPAVAPHLIYVAGMFALTFGVAVLSWHLLEKRCLRLKRYFS